MKTYLLLATVLFVGFILSGPVAADEPKTVLVQNSEEIKSEEAEKSNTLTQEETEQKTTIEKRDPEVVQQGAEKKSKENEAIATEASKKPEPTDKKTPEKTEQTKPVKQYGPDRRWIIKQRKSAKGTLPKKNDVPINWKDKKQQARCEKYLASLKDNFVKARYYSIQGDSCATADYAEAFLNIKDVCRQECPENFLEKSGYTDDIIRNLQLLNELGTKRCPDRIEILKPGEITGGTVK